MEHQKKQRIWTRTRKEKKADKKKVVDSHDTRHKRATILVDAAENTRENIRHTVENHPRVRTRDGAG